MSNETQNNGAKSLLAQVRDEAATAYDNAVEPLIGNRPNNTPKENK